MNAPRKIGFIGAGQMAEALARGFIASKQVKADNIVAANRSKGRIEIFSGFGTSTVDSNIKVVEQADLVFIAVKPWYVSQVLKEVRGSLQDSHIIISLAAGITLQQLQVAAGDHKLMRVMPNTPCMVRETASALCIGGKATEADAEAVMSLMNAVGKCYLVAESLLSAVSGLSGSGPAYIYIMIEALADGGVRASLPRDVAQSLAAQTVLGAAKMVLETGRHPGSLKDAVASPAGTTIAGVHELEKGAFRSTVMNAVLASANRADEIGRLYGS